MALKNGPYPSFPDLLVTTYLQKKKPEALFSYTILKLYFISRQFDHNKYIFEYN